MQKFDFGVEGEWHFHATSHGKGPCDGIGGTLKRKAARVSLTRQFENQITTPKLLFEWTQTIPMEADFAYGTIEEYNITSQYLEDRYSYAETIVGTQKFHCFIPIQEGKMIVKYCSLNEDYNIAKILKQ